MCSVGPMGRYQAALERLGLGPEATRFYAEHVLADERHQDVALHPMVAGLIEQEPFLGGEVVFGARALAEVERLFAGHLLDAWGRGESSLLPPAAPVPEPPRWESASLGRGAPAPPTPGPGPPSRGGGTSWWSAPASLGW